MDPAFIAIQLLNGLAGASHLFLAASGLTIVFGVTRIVNFAHGSLYMLGAYMAASLVPSLIGAIGGPAGFWLGVALAAIAVAAAGTLMELLLLRRIYRAPELFQLLATFGVVLVVQDLVIAVWGPDDIFGPRAPGLDGAVVILGHRFPQYELAMIAAGPLLLGALWLLFARTRFGALVRAATEDREMLGALGVNQALLFTGAVTLGALLAGLAGALQTPREPANSFMDINIIVEAFVVTVIGGMGSLPGAFLAALLIGELQAFGILVFPRVTLVLVFLVMALVLVLRPAGLLGRPVETDSHAFGGERPLRPYTPAQGAAALAVLAGLVALPLWADAFALRLAVEVMVFALFAMSLNLLVGTGGLVSFGHAAYFGLGAYGAGLLVSHLDARMEFALLAAPFVAGFGAALFGWFIVRLAGIYLAMLTLAAAEIVHVAAIQWVGLTGGDNGILGLWPSAWATSRTAYYYLALTLVAAAVYALRRVTYAPLGASLRAARDSERRAGAIGLDAAHARWRGFVLGGAAAGLAGGLYAFSKGNIDPSLLAIPTSIDALTMVLMGGIQTVIGPLIGAATLHLARDFVMPLSEHYRLLLGLLIIALVLVFPHGIAGLFARLARRWREAGR